MLCADRCGHHLLGGGLAMMVGETAVRENFEARCSGHHSWCCSASTAPTSRIRKSRFGKTPTTSAASTFVRSYRLPTCCFRYLRRLHLLVHSRPQDCPLSHI